MGYKRKADDGKDFVDGDICETVKKPMTYAELRARLKHIAGLCWGLSIDLANEIELREKTAKECERLEAENIGLQKEVQRLSNELYFKNYKRKRRVSNDN